MKMSVVFKIKQKESTMKSRLIKADSPAVWARFKCEDQRDGTPYIYKSKLVFWHMRPDDVVGVVIGTERGELREVDSFPNFDGYEYGKGAEQCVPLECSTP